LGPQDFLSHAKSADSKKNINAKIARFFNENFCENHENDLCHVSFPFLLPPHQSLRNISLLFMVMNNKENFSTYGKEQTKDLSEFGFQPKQQKSQ